MAQEIEFEKTATYLLARVTTAYRKALEDQMNQMKPIRLHGGQVFVLIELWRKDGPRQIDIAEQLNLKPPTINKMIKSLMEAGFVTRKRLSGDARSSRIFLTTKGLNMRKAVEAQWVELEADYLSGLTEAEQTILLVLLGKLRTAYTGRKEAEEE